MISPSPMSLEERLQAVLAPIVQDVGTLPFVIANVSDVNGPLFEDTTREKDKELELLAFFSGTKPITVTCLLQLYERGQVDLNDPVEKWLPEAADLQILEGWDEASDSPILRKPKNKMTVFHLMSHTAGFTYPHPGSLLERFCGKTGDTTKIRNTWAQFQVPLVFEPGTKFSYGYSTDWAGKVVEVVSGVSLDEYMKTNIFSKLDIHNTTFTRLDRPTAPFHVRGKEAGKLDILVPIAPDQRECFGGQGIYTTVSDYAKFLRIFINGGKSPSGEVILSPETMEKYIFTHVLPPEVKFPVERTNPDDEDFFPDGFKTSWTCNFLKNEEDGPTGKSAGSITWAGAGNVFYWVDPKKNIVGVWATQLFPPMEAPVWVHYRAFEKGIYDVLNGNV